MTTFNIILEALTEDAREHWDDSERLRARHEDRGCACPLCATMVAARGE